MLYWNIIYILLQLRHHPLPKKEQFVNLNNCAESKGFSINTTSNKHLAESLDNCVDVSDPVVNKVSRRRYVWQLDTVLRYSLKS